MKTHFLEATSHEFNWGKFLILQYEHEDFAYKSQIAKGRSLLFTRGYSPEHVWVLDIESGEGICVRPGGNAHADLERRQVYVCPLFEPMLEWLYKQDLSDITKLPSVVDLPDAPTALYGYRRPGKRKVKRS